MNKFGLHTFGLPSFGISDFRLTSFGGDGDGGRKAALPSPDCYYDFSLGSNDDANREVVKDQSGNGNDAKIYNCAFAGMSGYGGYVQTWLDKSIESDLGKIVVNSNSIIFEPTSTSALNIGHGDNYLLQPTEDNIKIKITGLKTDGTSKLQINAGEGSAFIANYDGVYSIKLESGTRNVFIQGVDSVVSLELLPEYEGALVLDGVDDYVALNNQIEPLFTILILYRQISVNQSSPNWAYIYDSICENYSENKNRGYVGYNSSNELLSDGELVNKDENCLLVKFNADLFDNILNKVILGAKHNNSEHANIAIYKFLGFKEALNEDQIKAVIQKYNLLDGVDDIEVS